MSNYGLVVEGRWDADADKQISDALMEIELISREHEERLIELENLIMEGHERLEKLLRK